MIRSAYIPEEQLPGSSTVVTDKSKSGLPTGQDREKEVVLPPGSATPKTPKKDDATSTSGNGRNLKSPSYNGPGTDEPGPAEHPRTLPTPGEDSPTKFDYNMPTRRTMTAYKARIPWKRQRKQRVRTKLQDHRYYERHKSTIRQRMKVWYKGIKNNQNYKTQKKDRRDNPNRYKRRKVGDVEIECCGTVSKEAYTPWSLGQHRHKTHGPARQRRHRQYVRDRARAHRQHHLWYQKNKHRPAFKRRQQLRRKNPRRFRMRHAELGVEVWVTYGPDAVLAFVTSVSPDRVTFEDAVSGMSHELTPQAFMQAVAFLDEADLHAMMMTLDEHGGENPYGDPTLDDLLAVASLYGLAAPEIDTDVPLDEALLTMTEEVMSDWDGDPEMSARVASAWLRAGGQIILYDQEPAGDWEKPDTSKRPYRSQSPNQWTDSDSGPTHDPTPGDYPDYDTTPNFGGGSGKVIPDHLKHAATLADIESGTASDVRARARGVKVSLAKADPKRGIWTFRAAGSEGRSYTIKVQAVAKGNTKDVGKLHLRVSCDCDFFRYQGPEHHAKADGYLYGKPRGTAAVAHEKDPKGNHKVCKHILVCLMRARQFRIAHIGSPWFGEVVGDLPCHESRIARIVRAHLIQDWCRF